MIKGFKHMKMATIITLSVAVISLLCLSCLYLVMTSSVTRTSTQGSIDNMLIICTPLLTVRQT